ACDVKGLFSLEDVYTVLQLVPALCLYKVVVREFRRNSEDLVWQTLRYLHGESNV
ncbi:hypothetical protein KIPB_013417, partial [Kipferlia bialata]